MFILSCIIALPIALGAMYVIKSKGWDIWNKPEDRWK